MKRKLFLILSLFLGLMANAQNNISVASFRLAETDLDANTHGTQVLDQNGHTCALIKVETTQTGFAFDVGMMGITKVEQHTGEIWVYVPFGVKHITIQHQQLGTLRDYYFPCSIEQGKTYIMQLTTGTVETIVKETVQQQYLVFQVTPADAALEVNDQIWPVSAEGTARKFVNFGTYDYRVQAPNYHPEIGKVTVNDPNNKKIMKVDLKPNFGWIEVSGTGLQGASVYIDNALIGKAPCKSEALKSGQHSVKIAKELYETYTQTVTVADNETTKISPSLTADFANITLAVDADAEIWVNDELKGTRRWTGSLATGTYKIECKMASHETTLTTKEITNGMNGQTISLNAPRPIYGSLNIESSPDFCDIYIDGKKVGETPMFVSELLIGRHEVKISKTNYADYTETVTIAKGETKTVNATLSSTATVRFTCNAAGATLYVDGKALGSASGSYALGYGSHSLRTTAEGYDDYTGSFTVSPNNTNCTISMKAKFDNRTLTFTVNGVTFKMLPVEGGTFTMGATSEQGNDADSDERPTHSVTLSSFYMGETEVTQALWQAVMGSNPSYYKGNNLPVVLVSWNDCQDFVTALNELCASQLNGRHFALPTEAQWEYAARGGKHSEGYKYSGSNTIVNVAQYSVKSDKPLPVGTKTPNELGLYDMSGNVLEWCSDWMGSYGSNAQTNPAGPSSGSTRVCRGGSWIHAAGFCRVSCRGCRAPVVTDYYLGLRLALCYDDKTDDRHENIVFVEHDDEFEGHEIYQIVEEMPVFPGGELKLREYLTKNVKYPEDARQAGIKGRVFVNFVIDPNGSVSNVKVLRGIGGGCDEEAMRVIKSMPKWNPGKQRGKFVRVSYTLPVNFQ